MSLKSWERKFYPIAAQHACGTAIKATKHSLQKWTGLKEKSLRKHNIFRSKEYRLLRSDSVGQGLYLSADNCSLCHYSDHVRESGCGSCPITKAVGYKCTASRGPWIYYTESGDPTYMILTLKATRRHLQLRAIEKTGDAVDVARAKQRYKKRKQILESYVTDTVLGGCR